VVGEARAGGSPRGFTVALVGPDGSGKSTVARSLVAELDRSGIAARSLYMGVNAAESNRLLPTSRLVRRLRRGTPPADPAEAPQPRPARRARPWRAARTLLRLTNRVAEEWYRQLLAWRATRRGEVVVFDRHFFADYHASDIVGRRRSLERRVHGWLLARAYPRPDVTVFLDAPGDVLHARKGEGTPAWLDRRRQDYLALAALVSEFHVVDATAPVADVTAAIAGLVADRRWGVGDR